MEALKILEKQESLTWDYDEDADVLYISVGKPTEAIGMDVGEGVIMRYKEGTGELVGITILGVRKRSLAALK